MGKVDHIDGGAIMVGTTVELTREEARELHELTVQMHSAIARQNQGWLLVYLQAHKGSHQLLRRIIQRAHAT